MLVDVRLNAVSRRVEFSKASLKQALHAAGVEYLYALWAIRGTTAPASTGRVSNTVGGTFRLLLETDAARADMSVLNAVARTSVIAVICVEADENQCHRKVVVDEDTAAARRFFIQALRHGPAPIEVTTDAGVPGGPRRDRPDGVARDRAVRQQRRRSRSRPAQARLQPMRGP